MASAFANAFPRKRFFLEMFTRDISFEDCLLDLIDNSIDSLVRLKGIDPAKDILALKRGRQRTVSRSGLPFIRLTLDPHQVVVEDNCGGIPLELVENEVFTFGHSENARLNQQLGIYGVGLKRAIFKIAERFDMVSRTATGSFNANLDIDQWAARDSDKEDWAIPIKYGNRAERSRYGTTLTFSPIREEVKMRLRDRALLGKLTRSIAQTYSLFLERYVRVTLNGAVVEPEPIPIGTSDDTKPGQADFSKGQVRIRIFCGLAARSNWMHEKAGWYVLCNGRVVLTADKTELTGWGVELPSFHSKYKGFVGIVIFRSKDPLALPWTTTKRGLNQESPAYQDVKREMIVLARPIISFLNRMYSSDYMAEEPEEREIAAKVAPADLRQLAVEQPAPFKVERKPTGPKTDVRIAYRAAIADVERVKRSLDQPRWSANQIGKHTFDHFLKTECPE